MVVEVAQAIAVAQGTIDWWSYVDAARSAIRAMREPNPDMLEAVLGGLPDWGTLPDDWRAMIDHALDAPVVPPEDASRILISGSSHVS